MCLTTYRIYDRCGRGCKTSMHTTPLNTPLCNGKGLECPAAHSRELNTNGWCPKCRPGPKAVVKR
jgi:hypothetical protein